MGATGKMLKNGRSDCERGCRYFGCSCCNPKRVRRAAKKGVTGKEKRTWKREAQAEQS
jgi:hypothetical protein